MKCKREAAPRPIRRLAMVLAVLLGVFGCGSFMSGGVYAAAGPQVRLQGTLSDEGDQLLLSLSVSEAVFNVIEVGLEWDPSVLALSRVSDNQPVSDGGNGRISSRNLAGVIRLSETSQTADQGGWIERSSYNSATTASAGEAALRFHGAVSAAASCDGVYTPDGGGVYMDSGSGLEIAAISFQVLDREALANLSNPPLWLSENGLLLAALEELDGGQWNLWGYRDNGLASVALPADSAPVNQGDGTEPSPEWLSGSGGDPESGSGGGDAAEGDGSGGGIEIVEPPNQNQSGTGGGTAGSGTGGTGAGTTGTGGGQAGAQTGAGSQAGSGQAGGLGGGSSYTDLTGHWARSSLEKLVKAGLLSGYADGTLRPDAGMTRGEFCVVASKLLGLTERESSAVEFSDAKDHWAAGWIAAASQTGLASGTGGGRFSPDAEITREELMVMSVRLLDKKGVEPEAGKAGNGAGSGADEPGFTDSGAVSPWAKEAVRRGKAAGLAGGYEDGSFRPGQKVTRAEMAVVMEQLRNLLEGGGAANA